MRKMQARLLGWLEARHAAKTRAWYAGHGAVTTIAKRGDLT